MKIASVLREKDLDPEQYQNELNVANVSNYEECWAYTISNWTLSN